MNTFLSRRRSRVRVPSLPFYRLSRENTDTEWCGVGAGEGWSAHTLPTLRRLWTLFLAVLLLLALMAYGAGEAKAHGRIAAKVPNHHQWIRMAVLCETRGIIDRWRYNGPSGFDGGLQFSPSTWVSTTRDYPRLARYRFAWQAPAWAQIAAANILKRRRGLQPWPHCQRFW